ncbi:MAG: Serine-protein kinase RsbW [Chloroflexi bacterium ADurb.Bin360]|nr:MAG: Serine-protein kinase RsbW [Chloroflexi bacterium ADurb.Bin360]
MEQSKTCSFPAVCASLEAISLQVKEAADVAGLDDDAAYAIQLAVEEACDNIIEHAYGNNMRGDIECTCEATPDGLVVTLRDHGDPFDPDLVPPPNLDSPLEERDAGGLGLHFIRKLTDDFCFQFDAEQGNVLMLFKRRSLSE